jgi:peptidoglycan/xylan/chitin deacetylase (PgdA/CDA1 family)
MQTFEKGTFIISLDFELMWGVRDKRTIKSYGENIRGVRQVIPSLLQLFDQYHVKATFATVGFLFARNKEDLFQHLPSLKPNYHLKKYSPYENDYMASIGYSEADDVYHYGLSLIQQIQQYPGQEIATHTFSHYYCLENASLKSFEADLVAAKNIAAIHGVELKSIIFPRNQYSSEHISICKKLGFIAYRGNEQSVIYTPRSNGSLNKAIRAVKFADSYVNLTGHHTFRIKGTEGIINLPASGFLRPISTKTRILDSLRLQRIKASMTYAAKRGEAYHLWWHPHNFGINLDQNLSFLEEILKHFQDLQQRFGMQSKSMKAIAEENIETHAL